MVMGQVRSTSRRLLETPSREAQPVDVHGEGSRVEGNGGLHETHGREGPGSSPSALEQASQHRGRRASAPEILCVPHEEIEKMKIQFGAHQARIDLLKGTNSQLLIKSQLATHQYQDRVAELSRRVVECEAQLKNAKEKERELEVKNEELGFELDQAIHREKIAQLQMQTLIALYDEQKQTSSQISRGPGLPNESELFQTYLHEAEQQINALDDVFRRSIKAAESKDAVMEHMRTQLDRNEQILQKLLDCTPDQLSALRAHARIQAASVETVDQGEYEKCFSDCYGDYQLSALRADACIQEASVASVETVDQGEYEKCSSDCYGDLKSSGKTCPVGMVGMALAWSWDSVIGKILTVQRTHQMGPADAAGIKEGDEILGVAGQAVLGKDMKQVEGLLEGVHGTAVKVTVVSRGGAPRTVILTRQESTLPIDNAHEKLAAEITQLEEICRNIGIILPKSASLAEAWKEEAIHLQDKAVDKEFQIQELGANLRTLFDTAQELKDKLILAQEREEALKTDLKRSMQSRMEQDAALKEVLQSLSSRDEELELVRRELEAFRWTVRTTIATSHQFIATDLFPVPLGTDEIFLASKRSEDRKFGQICSIDIDMIFSPPVSAPPSQRASGALRETVIIADRDETSKLPGLSETQVEDLQVREIQVRDGDKFAENLVDVYQRAAVYRKHLQGGEKNMSPDTKVRVSSDIETIEMRLMGYESSLEKEDSSYRESAKLHQQVHLDEMYSSDRGASGTSVDSSRLSRGSAWRRTLEQTLRDAPLCSSLLEAIHPLRDLGVPSQKDTARQVVEEKEGQMAAPTNHDSRIKVYNALPLHQSSPRPPPRGPVTMTPPAAEQEQTERGKMESSARNEEIKGSVNVQVNNPAVQTSQNEYGAPFQAFSKPNKLPKELKEKFEPEATSQPALHRSLSCSPNLNRTPQRSTTRTPALMSSPAPTPATPSPTSTTPAPLPAKREASTKRSNPSPRTTDPKLTEVSTYAKMVEDFMKKQASSSSVSSAMSRVGSTGALNEVASMHSSQSSHAANQTS